MRVSRPLGAALTRLALVALVVASCQTTGTSLQSTAAGYRPDDSSVPPSPYAQVRWKAVLLAGDNSIKSIAKGHCCFASSARRAWLRSLVRSSVLVAKRWLPARRRSRATRAEIIPASSL
jgi:hypothetical protein